MSVDRWLLVIAGFVACSVTLPANAEQSLAPKFHQQAWKAPGSLVQPVSYRSSDAVQVDDVADDRVFFESTGSPFTTAGYSSGGCNSCGSDCGSCGGCVDACTSCCDSGCGFLGGLIKPSDRAFNFTSPMSNPLFFEDPRTLTEARLIYANHNIPNSNALFGGGNVQFWALQIRAALTQRLSFIATKDGYLDVRGNNPGFADGEGWADVSAGLKYNLIRRPESQFLLSGGFTFETDLGAHQVFQGRGDGEFNLFLTGYKQIFGDINWISTTGFRLPTDTAARSTMWYWSNHLDYEFFDGIFGLVELNWFHWTKSGRALPGVNFEGGDLFNLGSGNVAGNDIVTAAIGGRVQLAKHAIFGVGWEAPLTNRRDLLRDRLYADFTLRF